MEKLTGNDVEIIQSNPEKVQIKIDGVTLNWVREFEYTGGINGVPEIRVTFTPMTVNFKKGRD
jgi:hypothetical protein